MHEPRKDRLQPQMKGGVREWGGLCERAGTRCRTEKWYREGLQTGFTGSQIRVSINKHLSGTYNVPGTALSTEDLGQTK